MRAELFGHIYPEEAHFPVAVKYDTHMPLAYRQRRRVYESSSESQEQNNKNRKKTKNTRNNDKKTSRTTIKQIMHPVLEKFKEGIASAAATGLISKPNGDRVKGKQTTLVNEWPWIVYIERNVVDFGLDLACNGLLLDNSSVLTSRDCVMYIDQQPFGVADLSVRIGDHDLDSTTETVSKTVGVSKVTMPLKNGIFDLDNAFAILHLKEEVQLTDSIRPICLPVSYNSFNDDSGLVAGWDLNFGSPVSPLPNAAKVNVLDPTICKKAVEEFFNVGTAEEIENMDVTCAADNFGVGVVCSGEQGSALTRRDRRGAYYVTGIAGGIQECFYAGVPTIFSKIEPDNQFFNIALA